MIFEKWPVWRLGSIAANHHRIELSLGTYTSSTMRSPTHLVVVCGHAIWLGGPKRGWDEAEWLIEGYKRGETPTFIEHIKVGVHILSRDASAVLVFSG